VVRTATLSPAYSDSAAHVSLVQRRPILRTTSARDHAPSAIRFADTSGAGAARKHHAFAYKHEPGLKCYADVIESYGYVDKDELDLLSGLTIKASLWPVK
jgi:hypothetical protein